MFLSGQPKGVVPLAGGAVEPLAERNPVPPTFTLEEPPAAQAPRQRASAHRASVKEADRDRKVQDKSAWERFKERAKLNGRRRLQYIESKRLANRPDQLATSLQRIEKMSDKEVGDQLTIKDSRSQVRIADTASDIVISTIGAILERTFVGKNKGCVMAALKKDADLHTALATEMACIPLLSEGKLRLAMMAGKDIAEGAMKARSMPEGKMEVVDLTTNTASQHLEEDLPILPALSVEAPPESKEVYRAPAFAAAPRTKKPRKPLSESQRK